MKLIHVVRMDIRFLPEGNMKLPTFLQARQSHA